MRHITTGMRPLPVFYTFFGTLLLTGCSVTGSDTTSEQRSFGPAPERLTVTVDVGEVEISPADVSEIEVTRRLTAGPLTGVPSAHWERNGDTLDLSADCGALIAECDIGYEILVPPGSALTLDSQNVETLATGFTTPLVATTTNGTLTVRDSSGPLRLESENGTVSAKGISTQNFEARTENGTIDAHFTRAPTDAQVTTDNGKATLALPDTGYDVTTVSDNGEVAIELREDPESAHAITARTGNGTILLTPAN